MASFTFALDGVFGIEDLAHLTSQVTDIPTSNTDRYDYEARARRRFKGKVTIQVEEIAPLPKPETPADEA